jgi:hypothetical protein
MSENMSQNPETGEWETAQPLPFLGVGVDWEVYGNERPMRAVGYIGHREVAEVKAGGRKMLGLKMAVAALPYRRTPQDTPHIKAAPSPSEPR